MIKTSQRVGSFDVLKILAILLIIMHHYALWTEWHFPAGFHLNKLAAQTLLLGGKLGVNIFIMITGYFLIKSVPKAKSLFQVWVETTLISVVVYLFLIFNPHISLNFEWKEFIFRLFPVVFGEYWFVTSYSLMYLCIPIMNKLLLNTDIFKIKKALIFWFFILSPYTFIYYSKGMNFSHPVWFLFLYAIGAYFKLDEENIKKIKTIPIIVMNVLMFALGIGINGSLQIILANKESFVGRTLSTFGWKETIFYTRDSSPYLLIFAALIFILFLKLNIKSRKIYIFIARASFGVYLLQSSQWFSTEYLWPILVNGSQFDSGKEIVLYGFLISIIIFIVGIILYIFLMPVIKMVMIIFSKPLEGFQIKVFGIKEKKNGL
ncbi:acyltransferase family protein [Enterococcus gallinarum]|uniref:acyltransferase family protein n=1 Tax=Enterococcus gallinarum TaxID=1353 RepID=UPI001559BF01|nr:acyltransferase family protein [Enterococcus gallinarum]NQE02834.1 acyltransferase family protein [Enterococcus gallinarum]